MLSGALILVAVLLLTVLLAWGLERAEAPSDLPPGSPAERARRALGDCERVLALIHALQQHRGMSVAWLSGDRGFESLLRAKRRDVGQLLQTLEPVAQKEEGYDADACISRAELSLLASQWMDLCDTIENAAQRPDPEDSITRRSLLVARALGWLESLGLRRVGPVLGDDQAGLLSTWVSTLPALGEHLGQARAIGSGAAARGRCTPAERLRLHFLASRAESLMHQAVVDTPRLPAALPAIERVVRLLGVLRSDLLEGQPPGAERYFAEATAAIDAVYAWMQGCEDALAPTLAARAGAGSA